MAVGNAPLPEFASIQGIRIGVACAGIKQAVKPDVTIFEIAEGATTVGVFTTNAFCAAPVHLCKNYLQQTSPRYLLINTGNANAGTGEEGMINAVSCTRALAEKTDVREIDVLPFSTGVIGEPLPVDKIINGLDEALAGLSENNWSAAASAIMTTDTRPKGVSVSFEVAGQTLNLSGISKGAGMIKPNMATMLAYVAIDAKASESLMQSILNEANRLSFNRITVDGDTSTNDSAILIATGQSDLDLDKLSAVELDMVKLKITQVFIELAQLIIRDGEGANKFVHVRVTGGATESECEQVAYTVAESPLVKTALFASDPNWGRILAAVGRAGLDALDVDKVSIKINDVLIAENGGRAQSYTEEAGTAAVEPEEIVIHIELQRGGAQATVWTSDLSKEYVTINAEYRT